MPCMQRLSKAHSRDGVRGYAPIAPDIPWMDVLFVEGEAPQQQQDEEHKPGDDIGHHQRAPNGTQKAEHSHTQLQQRDAR